MIAVLDVVTAVVFTIAIVALLRRHLRASGRAASMALAYAAVAVVLVISNAAINDDLGSLGAALLATLALGGILGVVHLLHPTGIDRFDVGLCGFVAFVIGASSWELAWGTLVGAAAISGLLGAVSLLRAPNADARVPFGLVLGAVAVGVMFLT